MIEHQHLLHIRRKRRNRIIFFLLFLFVLALIYFTSFGSLPFTGNIINKDADLNKSVQIEASLSIPKLSLDGDFDELRIEGYSDSPLYIEDQEIPLSGSENNRIVFTNYNGEISLDEDSLSRLKGESSSVLVNGITVSSKSKYPSDVEFGKKFNYDYISIKGEVFIEELKYPASGTIEIDDRNAVFNLNKDELSLKGFRGELTVQNNKLNLKGRVSSLEFGKISISG